MIQFVVFMLLMFFFLHFCLFVCLLFFHVVVVLLFMSWLFYIVDIAVVVHVAGETEFGCIPAP